ncbi:MAG TPA: hypothetical protein VIJ57_15760 [Hanamia sp.]
MGESRSAILQVFCLCWCFSIQSAAVVVAPGPKAIASPMAIHFVGEGAALILSHLSRFFFAGTPKFFPFAEDQQGKSSLKNFFILNIPGIEEEWLQKDSK